MNRLLLALALAIATAAPAAAQYGYSYGGYSAPCYGPSCYTTPSYYAPKSYGHSYSYGYRSQWSGWVYGPWATDPKYFIYYRTWYDHCGVATNHNDGWLYCRDAHGCYVKHCLISQYAYKPAIAPGPYVEPIGKTEVAYGPEYRVVQQFTVLAQNPGLVQSKDLPGVVDVRSLLAPVQNQAEARQLGAERAMVSHAENYKAIALAAEARELEAVRGRNALAREVQAQQSDERFLAEIKELFAVRRQQAVIGDAVPRAVINVGNPALAKLIQDRCVSCHGPTKAEKGLNFAAVSPNDTKTWKYAYRLVATGQMPKGGEALGDEDLELFDEQYQVALKAGR